MIINEVFPAFLLFCLQLNFLIISLGTDIYYGHCEIHERIFRPGLGVIKGLHKELYPGRNTCRASLKPEIIQL